MLTPMGGHRCARLILCVCSSVWKNAFASHQASQCLISASYSAFHLWTLHPPPPLPSSFCHCWSVWRAFKRLQGSAKLDRVRCNEKHARESYDIKCHTNTPRQTLQSFSRSICLPSSHTCNSSRIWENRKNCEPFGGWEKLIFAFNVLNLLLIGAAHINTQSLNWQRESRMKPWSRFDFQLSSAAADVTNRQNPSKLRSFKWHWKMLAVQQQHQFWDVLFCGSKLGKENTENSIIRFGFHILYTQSPS